MSIKSDILTLVQVAGFNGITAAELEALPGFAKTTYHGPVSGHLSHLHRSGRINRLTTKRTSFLNGKNRSFKIYVAPEFVNGRLTEHQGR
jgi:predicted transcriptional regulator